jgi:hypothetical protein
MVLALGAAVECSYEQEAAAVEEDKEIERGDERGASKRPDINELDATTRRGWWEGGVVEFKHVLIRIP